MGATQTSVIFVGAILVIVTYLSLTKRDVIAAAAAQQMDESKEKGGLLQTAVVVSLFIVAGGFGYHTLHTALQMQILAPSTTHTNATASSHVVSASPLGDMSTFLVIVQDTLDKLHAGDQSGATTRIADLEYEWDQAQPRLKPRNTTEWTRVDGKIDTVLRELRAVKPNLMTEKSALEALLAVL